MRRLISKAKPDLVVLTETDFWYHFLKYSHENKALIVLVNGKISERSYSRLKLFPSIARRLYQYVDLFCVQSSLYAERFFDLGVQKNLIHTVPNLKFESDSHTFDQREIDLLKIYLISPTIR